MATDMHPPPRASGDGAPPQLERVLEDLERVVRSLGNEEFPEAWRRVQSVFEGDSERRRASALRSLVVGQRVAFRDKAGLRREGELKAVNRKTVEVCTGDGAHWRVSPHLVRPV